MRRPRLGEHLSHSHQTLGLCSQTLRSQHHYAVYVEGRRNLTTMTTTPTDILYCTVVRQLTLMHVYNYKQIYTGLHLEILLSGGGGGRGQIKIC